MVRVSFSRLTTVLGLLGAQQVLSNPVPVCEAQDIRGAVASESAVCSRVGIDLLKAGGNAADAMVGTTLCVGVIGMYHSGIGGGGFMLIRTAADTYEDVDFRETAPAAAYEQMYMNNTKASLQGGLASGVPGELRGLEYLHKNHGVLPWPAVVAPAIDLARNGFTVTADLVTKMDGGVAQVGHDFLTEDPTWAIDFAPSGTRVQLNDTMTRNRYADTLEMISAHGVDVFYSGSMANATIAALRGSNGIMTLDDLRNYTIAIRQPSQITYHNQTITSCSAPSSGVVALAVMKIIEGYDMSMAPASPDINLTTHRLDEAIRFGYGFRTILGDPSFVPSLSQYQSSMVSASTADEIRGKIFDDRSQDVSAYNPKGLQSLETPGTSHIVTADASGLAITLTTTINLYFGSALMVPETGVIMNNEMNDFSIPDSSNAFGYLPNPSNYIRPGKRPLSSIAPTIVTVPDGPDKKRLFFVTGSAGGSRIITAVIQNLWNVLDRGMAVDEALKQPRLHDQLVPNHVVFEYGYDNATTAFMQERGHNISFTAPGQSTANGLVQLSNGTFVAAGEPRQEDSAGFAL